MPASRWRCSIVASPPSICTIASRSARRSRRLAAWSTATACAAIRCRSPASFPARASAARSSCCSTRSSPRALAIPERVLADLAPTPFGYDADPRGFRSPGAPAFNQLEAARTLATQVVGGLLSADRAARLVALRRPRPVAAHAVGRDRSDDRPHLGRPAPPAHAALQRVAQRAVVDRLHGLAGDPDAVVQARADAEAGLRRIARLAAAPASRPTPRRGRIARWRRRISSGSCRAATRRPCRRAPPRRRERRSGRRPSAAPRRRAASRRRAGTMVESLASASR